jgi:stage V sporulation protein B
MAVKNSIFQLSKTIVEKFGALIFMILVARLLLPELFGLYSLALSTIVLFASLTSLGIGTVLVKFLSNSLEKKDLKTAKSYLVYTAKIKLWLGLIASIILVASAKLIAHNYYNKPIFLALLAGALYILSVGFIGFIEGIFQASNQFKYPLFKEFLLQTSRIILVPLTILLFLKNTSTEVGLFLVIFALSLSYFIALVFIFFLAKRRISFLKSPSKKLSKKDKKGVNNYIIPLSVTFLSGIFFSYIDIIMLGRFVLAENIGCYRVAFSLVASISPFIAFSVALFPIFSRIKGKRLERALKKSVNLTFILAIFSILATLTLAPIMIWIAFGSEYMDAVPFLRILSALLISMPISAIYTSYLISKGRQVTVAKLLIFSTILNIILNYVLIKSLIPYGEFWAVIGVSIATITSRYFYLFALMAARRIHK